MTEYRVQFIISNCVFYTIRGILLELNPSHNLEVPFFGKKNMKI